MNERHPFLFSNPFVTEKSMEANCEVLDVNDGLGLLRRDVSIGRNKQREGVACLLIVYMCR